MPGPKDPEKRRQWIEKLRALSTAYAASSDGISILLASAKKAGDTNRIHGLSSHPDYNSWCSMMCQGIPVCFEWREPRSFIAWNESLPIDKRRKKGSILRRTSLDKGYGPDNCYWISRSECATIAWISNYAARCTIMKTVANNPDLLAKRMKHGYSNHLFYRFIYDAHYRCLDSTYGSYVVRGITVCNEWSLTKEGIESFISWNQLLPPEKRYKSGFELDRIDNNRGYSPDNCQWLSKLVHALKSQRERRKD